MISWQCKSFKELSVQELYGIMRLRQEVFIVEQNCPYLDADGKDLKSLHLMGYEGQELTAYSRLVAPGDSYTEVSIGRVVSSTQYRKSGYGKLLMEESIRQIETIYGKCPIRIGAQMYLQRFYESFGFVREGEEYLEDGIPHIIMVKPE
ncbi:MAG: family acetyltransferase [Bacteroidota bacterium]|nr:family acetyltransferase [Bacteroidota bacterium]